MTREDLYRYTGSLQQIAYARRIRYDEGRARGLEAVEVKNGPLRFVILLDKCMDIGELSWRGDQVNFLSKPGLNGRNPFDTNGAEAQRSIMGGLFFTCGYENICAPYTDRAGKTYPMHGRMRTSPAEHVSIQAGWKDGTYTVSVSGDIREAELFGENLLLHRTIETRLGIPTVRVTDRVYNEGFREEPFLLMYHCNMGFPFLTERARLILPTVEVTPRDPVSAENALRWDTMDPPKDNESEYVYLHRLAADLNGNTFAALVDDTLARAVYLGFNRNRLPEFGQWKSTASGDYVMGLEPGNAKVYGRAYHEREGTLPVLAPGAETEISLQFTMLEGMEIITSLEEKSNLLRKKEKESMP